MRGGWPGGPVTVADCGASVERRAGPQRPLPQTGTALHPHATPPNAAIPAGTRGLGFATCKALASEGKSVIFTARSLEQGGFG
jgi:hypothetical protein